MRSFLLIACILALAAADNWAVIIAGSDGYGNYRHQANVAHQYHQYLDYGVKPEHIIVFDYDDVNFIIINKKLSYYKRKKTILHELAHIELNHLNQIDKELFSFKIDNYEDTADIYIKFLLDSINID